jgi:hypothetical protein
MSTRLDDLCNEGQRHMSEGDDRPSSEFNMSTRVDDMCNEEQRIYVTTVDVTLFSFTCLSSMKVGLIWTKIPKNYQKSKEPVSKNINTVFKFLENILNTHLQTKWWWVFI